MTLEHFGRPTVPVSVIIPAYNIELSIGETLDSVFSQTVRPFEVIVVDDGSTDQTAEIAREKGAVVIRQRNLGVSAARNAGVARSSATWIAYLDGDDVWAREKLELQFAALSADTSCGFVLTDFWQFDSRGCLNRSTVHEIHRGFDSIRRTELASKTWLCDPGDLSNLIPLQNVVLPSTMLVRRDLMLAVGGWDEAISFSEDIEIGLRLLSQSHVLFVDVPLVGYRRHSGNASANRLSLRSGEVKILERVLASPSSYLASTVEWYRHALPTIMLKAGRMAVVYGDQRGARRWLRESWRAERRVSTCAWIVLSYLVDNVIGRKVMSCVEKAWFFFKTYRSRTPVNKTSIAPEVEARG